MAQRKKTKKSGKELVSKEGKGLLFSEETAVYLVDDSGSMGDNMVYGQLVRKHKALLNALNVMMDVREEFPTTDRLGFVHFGGSEGWLLKPTTYSLDQRLAIDKSRCSGGTPMLPAIKLAAKELLNFEGMLRMVVISDGEPNLGGEKKDVLEAGVTLFNEVGIIIDTVGIGVPGATSAYDEEFMTRLADLSGGQFFPAADPEELRKLLQRMARERGMLLGAGIKQLPALPHE